ncbi:MAG: NAD(P)/FAD-dependent oxidoreductase, partial [Proteobacteria bacterium]|nr:NAD(P)/FAD-dependent oxidoreductase [Pseudomonadota bacterium]
MDEESVRIDLKKIFAGKKVNVVPDEIKQVDLKEKKLISKHNEYAYDYLVVATGGRPTYFGIEGAKENSFALWSYEDAIRLKEHILNMFRLAMKETDDEERKKLLTFVVAGAGFTGVEMVGELAEWVNVLCEKFYIERNEVKLYIVDLLPTILKCLPDKLIKKAEKILKKLDVNIITDVPIACVGKDFVCLGEKGDIPTYTCIWTTGIEGSEIVGDMDIEKKGRKRIIINERLQSVDDPNVYVVGDNMFFIPENDQAPVPQMVENCEHAAPVAAHNIHADVNGGTHKSYNPTFHGVMVCIGGRHGVAHVGVPKLMMGFGSLPAMFIKHLINVMYFLQVAGWNKVYSYLLHEIFHVKNKRSFLGGHLSKRSPNFWMVPLRIFVGLQWL